MTATPRHTADSITDDALDALYAERDHARRELAHLTVTVSLRTCLMPGCLRQYDSIAWMTGEPPGRPEWSGKGWRIHRGLLPGGDYACPDHAPLVTAHMTHSARDEAGVLTVVCRCGWQATARRWHRVARALWEEHLLTVADEAAALPADQPTEEP